ncbi:MAG: hypothetical protein JO061_23290 [Acidobacteriaceae bacterium]|nr:hypothetical protein [Acidobacteriaceae bacterium]
MKVQSSLLLALLTCVPVAWSQTTLHFSADPRDVLSGAFAVGPFPTNALTVTDKTQQTGIRIALPNSANSCDTGYGAVCSNQAVLNQIDGFSVNPRLMVCFSGPIDPNSLAAGLSIVPMSGPGGHPVMSHAIGLQQLVVGPSAVDSTTKCVFGKPAQVLDQDSQYLLLATDALKDSQGGTIAAEPTYTACAKGTGSSYCSALADALEDLGGPKKKVIGASLFTTMTVTKWLEQARQFVGQTLPVVLPAGFPFSFAIGDIRTLTYNPSQSALPPQNIPVAALSNVQSVAFGTFLSPLFLNPSNGLITTPPTTPTGYVLVSFHVFLPAGVSGEVPVVIFGHGLGDNQFGASTYIASTLAKNGFATLALEITGHGFGAGSTVSVLTKEGNTFTEWTPGRGVQLPNSKTIGPTDGCIVPGPFGVRDCFRQSTVDLMTLVHTIQGTNGLGLNLDPNRIYYIGQSLGSLYGALMMAVEPSIKTAVLNSGGGSQVDVSRLSVEERPGADAYLGSVTSDPDLLNVLAGLAPEPLYFRNLNFVDFNDSYPFPAQPPVTSPVNGALADQAAFETAEWIDVTGDPLGYAAHLKTSPLSGVSPKQVLFQFGTGDLEVPNPTESALVLAANARSTTSLFDFVAALPVAPELAVIEDPNFPGLPILPHRALTNPTILGEGAEASISFALQQQAADFLKSNGSSLTDANRYLKSPFSPSSGLFTNAPASLPETLGFIQIAP